MWNPRIKIEREVLIDLFSTVNKHNVTKILCGRPAGFQFVRCTYQSSLFMFCEC